MKLTYQHATIRAAEADVVAFLVPRDKELFNEIGNTLSKVVPRFEDVLDIEDFKGKEGEVLALYPDGKMAASKVLLIGMGEVKYLSLEKYRRCGSLAVKRGRGTGIKTIGIMLPDAATMGADPQHSVEDIVRALAEGAILGSYKYDKYLTDRKHKESSARELTIFSTGKQDERVLKKILTETKVICESVFTARNLANAPGNEIYPESLAAFAEESGKRHGFSVRSWEKDEILQAGFGGLMAVSSGSARPPRFVIMEYSPGKKDVETIVLVGKGVTFDSGGISIKPAAGMAEMKMDMAGAAAVIGTMECVSRLKLPVSVIGLVPTTENMPGAAAFRPGDIVTHYGGKTSEIDNTDAEGRLILADALAYAVTFQPDAVIDLATLTGACVVALGQHAAGMMGNDDELIGQLKVAGDTTYERVWQLPLYDEYEKQIKSDVADVKNVGGRWAGAITAGWFLKKFIGDYRWVHLDVAGTAMLDEAQPYSPRGGSGYGVRLLTQFLKNRIAGRTPK